MEKRIQCKKCKRKRRESFFYLNRTAGKEYRKSICKNCDNKARTSRAMRWRPHTQEQIEKRRLSNLRYRKSPKARVGSIIRDARHFDKRKGFDHRLTTAWVSQQISKPCSYCGERTLLMTLDRIDNLKGHVPENLNSACLRCNYLRRDMPFAAWIVIVPAVRLARERGLFSGWDGFGRIGGRC